MTLDELHAALLVRTRRVDKSNEMRTSIRKAIRMVHSAAYFPRDEVEEAVDLGGQFTDFKIPLPPRVRKIQQVAPLDANANPIRITTPDNTYDIVSSSDIINSFYERRSDICYVAGPNLTVKSSVGASKLYINFLAYPEVSDNNLETWLMRDHENVFIDAALSDFYLTIGREQLARNHKNEMMMQLQPIIDDHASIGGY